MRANFLRSRPNVHVRIAIHLPRPEFFDHILCAEQFVKKKKNNIKGKISSYAQREWMLRVVFLFSMVNVGKTFPSHLATLPLSFIVHVFFHMFFSCNKMMNYWTSPSQPSQPWICLLFDAERKKWQQNSLLFLPKMVVFIFHGDFNFHPPGIHIEPFKKKKTPTKQIQAIQSSSFTSPTRGSDTRGDSLAAWNQWKVDVNQGQ